jgi:hypothetical protein
VEQGPAQPPHVAVSPQHCCDDAKVANSMPRNVAKSVWTHSAAAIRHADGRELRGTGPTHDVLVTCSSSPFLLLLLLRLLQMLLLLPLPSPSPLHPRQEARGALHAWEVGSSGARVAEGCLPSRRPTS